MVRSSSSSGIGSVVSSVERGRRLALGKARRDIARRELELAQADEDVAEGQLEEALANSAAGSVGRVAALDNEGGNSARARPRSSAGAAAPPLQLERVQERATRLLTQETQEEPEGLPAKA